MNKMKGATKITVVSFLSIFSLSSFLECDQMSMYHEGGGRSRSVATSNWRTPNNEDDCERITDAHHECVNATRHMGDDFLESLEKCMLSRGFIKR